jgi:uncharacterized protein (TIGR00251 family)
LQIAQQAFANQNGDGLELTILTQPNASKTHFAEVPDGRIKLRVAAPAVDGAANKAVVEFLAKAFGVAKRQVEILKGQTSRRKTVVISQPLKDPFS